MNPELRQWLYLPDYRESPDARKLMGEAIKPYIK